MAEQIAKSKPLYEESEEEKRRRLKAQNLLNTRDQYDSALKSNKSVSGLAKAAGEAGSNYRDAKEAALNEGIGGPVMAQDVLNKPQARMVGDTLVGTAAGISASEWDKRDKSVASGNNPLMPTREMQPIGKGAMADAATKERYDVSLAASSAAEKAEADRAKSFSDTFNKYRAGVDAENKKVTESQRAAMTPEASRARFENFKNSIAERDATNAKVDAELRYATDEERLARRNFRALKRMVRRGKFVDPETLQKAADHMANTSNSLGNSRNVDVRRNAVSANVQELIKRRQERETSRYAQNPNNPYGGGYRGAKPSSGGLLSGTDPNQSSSFTGAGLNATAPTLEDDEYAKLRKGLYKA
jgi:hypothetical protein